MTVSAAVLQSIAVTPANPSIADGTTLQFSATGTYSDSSTQDLTSQVTWASATTSVATITAAGLATAVATGTSSISATLGAISGSTVLTVGAAVLQSIAVTPANPSVPKGLTQQFTATGTYSDSSTQDLTSQVTWASATTSVATIHAAGLATAVATGTSSISAMLGGISGSTLLTVTAAALESISVTPADPAIPVGEVQPFTATGTYSDNSTQDLTSQVTWASATTSVATIASDGLASGLAAGTTTVSATLGDVIGSTVLTVTPAVLEMIMVTPDNPAVLKGATESFMAMGMYSDNSTVDLTSQVTWGSSDTSVATISNDSGTQGLATAVGDGTSSISASLDGISGSTTITVSTADLNPVAVRDNGQAGYYQYGIWTIAAGGLNGTHSSADPATSSTATARWLLNVPAGTYDVWGTWASGASNATNATYSVYDGFTNLGSAVENQQAAPAGGQYGGVAWAMLGTFTVPKGRITVVLSASGANGNVVADGILLVSSMAMDESAMVASTPATTEATGSSSSTASDAITDERADHAGVASCPARSTGTGHDDRADSGCSD